MTQRPARPPHRLPRGAARRRAAGLAGRGPRRGRRARARSAGTSARPSARRTPPRWSSGRPSGPPSTRSSTSTSRGWSARARPAADADEPTSPTASGPRQRARRWPTSASARRGAGRRRPGGAGDGWPSRRSAGSARCRAAGPGCRSWSAYTALQRVSPAELVDRIVAGAAGRGPDRRARPRRAAGRRVGALHRGWSRPTPAAGSPRRRGPTTSPTSRSGRRIDRLDFTAARAGRPRGDAPRDLPAGPPAGDPADPGAPRPPPRPARLPAHRPRLDLHRRRPAGHPPPAEAPAPHRAGRALRRQRLGGQLRAVHADAGLRAARAVPARCARSRSSTRSTR